MSVLQPGDLWGLPTLCPLTIPPGISPSHCPPGPWRELCHPNPAPWEDGTSGLVGCVVSVTRPFPGRRAGKDVGLSQYPCGDGGKEPTRPSQEGERLGLGQEAEDPLSSGHAPAPTTSARSRHCSSPDLTVRSWTWATGWGLRGVCRSLIHSPRLTHSRPWASGTL